MGLPEPDFGLRSLVLDMAEAVFRFGKGAGGTGVGLWQYTPPGGLQYSLGGYSAKAGSEKAEAGQEAAEVGPEEAEVGPEEAIAGPEEAKAGPG